MGVPLEIVTGHLEGMLNLDSLKLESYLKKKIIGQDEALNLVCQRLLMSHTGLAKSVVLWQFFIPWSHWSGKD